MASDAPEVGGFGERAVALRDGDAEPTSFLAALYLLEPAPAGERAQVHVIARVDPMRLMQTSFTLALRDPRRRERQLNTFGAIEASVCICAVRVPRGREAATAQALLAHARTVAELAR